MSRPRCERCRWRPAVHCLNVVTVDAILVMHSCAACWPALQVAVEEVADDLGVELHG